MSAEGLHKGEEMKILLLAVAVVVILLLAALTYLGMFSSLKLEEREMGPYPFVYTQEPSTDFGKIGRLTKALGDRLETAGVTDRKPAQLYYPVGRGIQNQIGCVVDRAVGPEVLGAETFFRPIPAQRYVVAQFPFHNPLSFIVGYFRVDPAFKEYRKAKGLPESSAMVILDGDTIVYLQPLGQD